MIGRNLTKLFLNKWKQSKQVILVLSIYELRYAGGRDGEFVKLIRLFLTFRSSVEGLKHCSPLICVDETLLYGKYGGVLLVVLIEIKANWSWFFACMHS